MARRTTADRDQVARRHYADYGEANLPETSYGEDQESANKPDFLLKVKDERPGRKSRWTTVGAAWRRTSAKNGTEFFSINLNACVTLKAESNMPICMYANDKDREE